MVKIESIGAAGKVERLLFLADHT